MVQMILPTVGKTMYNMYTVLFCGNVAGSNMPPYVIYKGLSAKVLDIWMIGGPEGISYNVTKRMEDYVLAWFKDAFLKYTFLKPIVVFFDFTSYV